MNEHKFIYTVATAMLGLGLFLGPSLLARANADVVDTSVTIFGTCGIALEDENGDPLSSWSYGSLTHGQESSDKALVIVNTGSTQADIFLTGANWVDSGSVARMDSLKTHFDYNSGVAYASKAGAVYPFQTQTGVPLAGGDSVTQYYQVKIETTDPSFTGSLSQTLTLTLEC